MKPSVRSQLNLEALEERAVPAVTAVVDTDGDLNITGAPTGALVLTLTANETYSLTDGGGGVVITGGPMASGDVIFDLDFAGTGNDTITVNFATFSMGQNFIIDSGTGLDTVTLNGSGTIPGNIEFSNVNVVEFPMNIVYGGDITVDAEAESENEDIDFNRATIAGNVTLLTGNGTDDIDLIRSLFNGNLNIDTGSGNDDIDLTMGTTVRGDMNVLTGNGDDDITINFGNLNFLGVDAGFGNDDLILLGGTTINGNLHTWGVNTLDVPSTAVIGGTVGIDSNDENRVGTYDFDGTFVGGNIYIYSGNLEDTVNIINGTFVGGEVGLSLGNAIGGAVDNEVTLDGNSVISRNLIVYGGSGADSIDLDGNIFGSVFLRLGTGTNTVEADGIIEGSFEFIGGGGTDSATVTNYVGGNLFFNLGGGSNTVDMTMISEGAQIYYMGGSGVDSVTFDGNALRARLFAFLQGSNDTFVLGTSARLSFLYVDFGSGFDTFTNMLFFVPFRHYLRNLP